MEILPGLYHLKQDLFPVHPNTWTTINVVVGERLAIVDTGVPESAESLVLPCLARIGRSPTDVAAIVNTHGHGDHVGSNESLKRLSGASIMIHEADAPSLDRTGAWLETKYNPGPADVRLVEGDLIDLGGCSLEVVHLPGHTPGSIGLLLRAESALLTGDSLQGLGTSVQHLAFYNDPDAYVASLEKVLRLDVQHLALAHAYGPYSESHLHGADVKAFLETSLRFALGLDAVILEVLRRSGEPLRPGEVADEVCRRYGTDGTTGMATATVAAHLRRLEAHGEVAAAESGAGLAYRTS